MIAGIGIDMIEIERIAQLTDRQGRFPRRILTASEWSRYRGLHSHRQLEFLAGHFAAKEAYAKACGTGIGVHLSWRDIEMLPNEDGKPLMTAKDMAMPIHVSVSHTRDHAIAEVIIERPSS